MFKDSTLMSSILRGLFSADKSQTLFRRKISAPSPKLPENGRRNRPGQKSFPLIEKREAES